MNKKIPIVAIVGRANVGKSTLFNRLVGARQAIEYDKPGTTRDPVYGIVESSDADFWLVDTAGLKKPEDEFEMSIQDQIREAVSSADVIVVVVESIGMITDEDIRTARMSLKSEKPVLLVINKSDKSGQKPKFEKLGIKDTYETVASQGRGVEELKEAIIKNLPKAKKDTDTDKLTVSLLGRPNMGKSQLFNSLGKKQQALVSEVSGTTRDTNVMHLRYHSRPIELLDTAGIRRPGKINKGVEHFSVLRTLHAIEESDVCLLLIDALEGITKLDKKIAAMAKDAGKGLIIVVNKWDLIDKTDKTQDKYSARISYELQFCWWAPLIFVSAKEGKNVSKIFDLVFKVDKNRHTEIKTSELNNLLQAMFNSHPPSGLKNRHPKLKYGTQTGSNPPEFTIFGSQIEYLHWSYKRFIENGLREAFDFIGTPVVLVFKSKGDRHKDE